MPWLVLEKSYAIWNFDFSRSPENKFLRHFGSKYDEYCILQISMSTFVLHESTSPLKMYNFFEIMLPQPQASLPHSFHLERPSCVTENFINSTDAHSTPFFISIVLFQVSISMLLFFLTSVLFLWKFFRMYLLVQLEHFDSLLVY